MNFRECIIKKDKILMEGALGERLKREHGLVFDEHVAMARLIYDKEGANALTKLWGGCCGTDNRHMECVARMLQDKE